MVRLMRPLGQYLLVRQEPQTGPEAQGNFAGVLIAQFWEKLLGSLVFGVRINAQPGDAALKGQPVGLR